MKSKYNPRGIIKEFHENPEKGYEQLINSNFFRSIPGKVNSFWPLFTEALQYIERQNSLRLDETYLKTRSLQFLYQLEAQFQEKRELNWLEIHKQRPSIETFTKNLFKSLDSLERKTDSYFTFRAEGSQEAIRRLLKRHSRNIQDSNRTVDDDNIFEQCRVLFMFEYNLIELNRIRDLLIWQQLEMEVIGNEYLVRFPQENPKEAKRYIQRQLKERLSSLHERAMAHNLISYEDIQEGEIRIVDNFYNHLVRLDKTKKGVSNLTIDTFSEADLEELLKNNADFKYQYNRALAGVLLIRGSLNPADAKFTYKDNPKFSVSELFSAISCLSAFMWSLRFKKDESTRGYLEPTLIERLQSDNFPLSSVGLILTKDHLITLLRESQVLSGKSDDELKLILELLCDIDLKLPYNPVYKINSNYFLAWSLYRSDINLSRPFYDHFLSQQLFDTRAKKASLSKIKGLSLDKFRETNVLKELAQKIQTVSWAQTKIDFSYQVDNSTREIDLIAYSTAENSILCIQVKLSNSSKRDEKAKIDWVLKKVGRSEKDNGTAYHQIAIDFEYLNSNVGLNHVKEELDLADLPLDPKIYTLIVTDTFLVDGCNLKLGAEKHYTQCISIFELERYLLHEHLLFREPNWKKPSPSHYFEDLFELIRQNSLWDFLQDEALSYREKYELFQIEGIEASLGVDIRE